MNPAGNASPSMLNNFRGNEFQLGFGRGVESAPNGAAFMTPVPFFSTGAPLRTLPPSTFLGPANAGAPNPFASTAPPMTSAIPSSFARPMSPSFATRPPMSSSCPPNGSNPADAGSRNPYKNFPEFTSAAAAEASLGAAARQQETSSAKIGSAFEVLGVGPPTCQTASLDQGERFIQAIAGEKRPIPTWTGQPNTLRSWLKLLAYWEVETTVPREKWGLRLFQSFPEGSQPRKIADQITMQDLLSLEGYGMVLSAIIGKYKPFLEIAGPTSIDKYFYSGDRSKGESFANSIANKEVSRQEMETQLQEKIGDRVAGRVLLRQANLNDFQREMIALTDQSALLTFDQVAAMLRPLDRPELLAQAAGATLGQAAAKHYPVMNVDYQQAPEEDPDGGNG